MEAFYIGFVSVGLVLLHVFRVRIAFPSSCSLPPFQCGVLFRGGHPVRKVGPGRHRILKGREKIIFLDSRPIDVKSGYRFVTLADSTTAQYSFTATCEIQDAQKVLYSSASYTNLPIFVTLSVSRAVLNGCQRSQVESASSAVTDQVIEACRFRLTASGFELKSFRFTCLEILKSAPTP
jgi:hypothetical protein